MQGITIRTLGPEDQPLLERQPSGLFDHAIRPREAATFLASPDCVMIAALEGDIMLSFASGQVLRHPDKADSLFVNEVGTRDSHRRRGLARAVSGQLLAWARGRGIDAIWLATEPDNEPALALYRALGGDEAVVVGFGWGGALDD